MEKINEKSETGCCVRFNPEPWNEKEVKLQDKLFIKDSVRTIFYIPLNFGKVMIKNMEIIKQADALVSEPLMLSDCSSPWRTDIYIAVSKEIKGAKMEKISGTFLTKVFEGSYNNMGKWIKEMKAYVTSKGKNITKMYFFYTMCPKCEKYYKQNYTVILAQI